MEKNQTKYHFNLFLTCNDNAISTIEEERSKIPQRDNVDVTFLLCIVKSWRPSNNETNAILNLMDDFKCNEIMLGHFMDEIDPGVQEILAKATKTWNSLELWNEFSDTAFQFIHELIVANGVIQTLKLQYLKLSNKSWELFQSLGQVLSRPDCEVSDLYFAFNDDLGADCSGQMLETLTTNTSVTDLTFVQLTETGLTSMMTKQIHKFTQLTKLWIGILEESKSLDVLRPLLDNSSSEVMMNPSIETLTLRYQGVKPLSKVENDLLLQVARRYKKLRAVRDIVLTAELAHILRMNSTWRQYMTREPELPLSLWRFVLENVEKVPYSFQEQRNKAAIVASIRYELVQHIVRPNIRNFMVE